jgi:hypothetical protein
MESEPRRRKEVETMHKLVTVATAAALLLVTPGLVPAAHADHAAWFVGTRFAIGPLHFNIVARNPDYGPPGYYYRVARPIHYPHLRCTSRCFKGDHAYYHDVGCPVIRHHFGRHRFDPYAAFERHAPAIPGYYPAYADRGYWRGHGGSGRYDRRYDDRYHGRPWGRGDRHRGHRHHRSHHDSCPYRHDD